MRERDFEQNGASRFNASEARYFRGHRGVLEQSRECFGMRGCMRHTTKLRTVEELIGRSTRQRWLFIIGPLTRHTIGSFDAWKIE